MMRPALQATVLVLATACASSGPRPLPQPPALVGAPLAGVAKDQSGAEVRLDGEGNGVRVIDFFASWCEPCRAQFPALERLAKAHAGRVTVQAVSFDETRPPLDAFLAEHPVTFQVLWDPGGASAGALGIARLPTTVVVDGGGVVRWVHEGYQDGDAERVEAQLRSLLEP